MPCLRTLESSSLVLRITGTGIFIPWRTGEPDSGAGAPTLWVHAFHVGENSVKRNTFIIGGVVVIVLAIAALFGWETMTANAAATTRNLQTTTVQRGTIVATVSAAGNVNAPQQASLAFQTTGRVAQVNVHVGDSVKQGQVLMQLDTTDEQLALSTAQANLASAQANYDSAKAKNGTNNDQVIAAKAAVDKAQAALQQAQAAYDKIGGANNPSIGMTSQSVTLQQAYDDYKSAVANYNITVSGINDTAMRTAQAQLNSAQIAVQQAQANLDKAKVIAPFDGVVSAVNYNVGDSIGGGAAGVSASGSSSSSSSSGTSGSSTTSGGSTPAVSIVNLSNLQVDVTVAEVDLPKIKAGQPAQVTFDALPGKTYNGTVKEIGPAGTITQGVVNYPVTVALDEPDQSVKPGMTANLNIVTAQQDNTLVVPLRAVRTQGNQRVVTVLYKGQMIQDPVVTGLSNDQSTQITSGLREGDVVVLNQAQTQGTNPRGFGGGGFLFGR